MSRREFPRLGFVSMELYATLRPGVVPEAGGAGFQLALLCGELRRRGYPVSAVVGDFGQPARHEVVDGIELWRANRVVYDRSIPRSLRNVGRLWGAMRAARCAVWVLRSTRFLLPQVHLFARALGVPAVFMVANMDNCRPDRREGCPEPVHRLYNRLLPRTDTVTAQTEVQREMLRRHFGIEAALVPNGIPVVPAPLPLPERAVDWDVLWVGSLKPVKGPERLAVIARACPDLRIAVIGGPGPDPQYSQRIAAELAGIEGVTVLGFVPPDRIGELYGRTRLLLNTSANEGFSNTFLNAWSRGVPVCTTGVDPDGVIAARSLGLVEPDPERLATGLRSLLNDSTLLAAMARRCHEHVTRAHGLDLTCDQFLAALGTVLPGFPAPEESRRESRSA